MKQQREESWWCLLEPTPLDQACSDAENLAAV
jgi:hypothetical protein